MAEVDIHCNVMRCRKPFSFEKQACITSCSHIFCIECANSTFSKSLICPACHASLNQSDDIILTELNPSEEYKSSVLAGLKPEVIMDISTRAIAFYEYQTSQEILYRSMLQKSLEEKYKLLREKFHMVVRDLNHVIKNEKDKQTELKKELEQEKSKCQNAAAKLDEKAKHFQKLQTMYEKLKRQVATSNMQESFIHAPPPAQNAPFHPHNLIKMNPTLQEIQQPQQRQHTIILDESDVLSKTERMPTVVGGDSIYNQQHVRKSRPSRIPSPTNTIYPMHKHRSPSSRRSMRAPDQPMDL
ncbi:hypothetical protein BD560DRAFT_416850 [Blakeslea trispora]|nr:hypothetical protein BD560DRAFT_416850 [Blakeslea trispora]